MAIKVLEPGLATAVQDLGRPGYYHIGIPLSGGMDRHALAGANLLVGTVISADMDLIGQLRPNTPVKFVKVDMDQALAARKSRAELLAKLRASLAS